VVDVGAAVSGAGAQLGLTARVVRAILRNPALRRVELAFLLFNTVEYATWIAILLYAYEAIGPASVGVVAVIQLIPAAIVAPLAASLADRLPRRRVLLIGYLAQVVTFGLTWAAMWSMASPALVVGVAAAAAATLGFTRPTQGALLPSLSRTPEELTAANGLSGTIEGFGMLLGPLAAAAILAVGTPADVFGTAMVALLVATALVAWLPTSRAPVVGIVLAPEPAAMEAEVVASRPSVLEGVRLVAREPGTRIVVGILTLRMVVIGALDVLYILIALEVFGIGDSGAGLLNAAMGLGVVLGGAISFGICGRPRLAPELGFAAAVAGIGLVVVGAGVDAAQAAPRARGRRLGLRRVRPHRADDPAARHPGCAARSSLGRPRGVGVRRSRRRVAGGPRRRGDRRRPRRLRRRWTAIAGGDRLVVARAPGDGA